MTLSNFRTDDSIQMWDIESKQCVRNYVAPLLEKQTGVRVFNDMIACGNAYSMSLI